MCNFFSWRTGGDGEPMYLNAEQRAALLGTKNNPDSHTYIAEFYGFKGADEDMLNAYEYNPLTREFTIDRMPNKDDSQKALEWVKTLDFKTICPQLIIKPIVHPLKIKRGAVTEKEVAILKKWASVVDSVVASVWASVGASVVDSVVDSVWDSVWDSVRVSVRASVWASVGAYISSFFVLDKWKCFDHKPGENPFQSGIDLWESGLVPSFDGTTWRLHAGATAEIVYTWNREGNL